MPTYKIVFTNGEKREMICKASHIDPTNVHMVRFEGQSGETVALIPSGNILYIKQVKSD